MRSLLFGFCCFFGLAQSLFAQNIHFDPWQKFSDQSLMPSNVILQKSNNNDDIILLRVGIMLVLEQPHPILLPKKRECM